MYAVARKRWAKWLLPCTWGWTVPEYRCARRKSPAAPASSRMVPPKPAKPSSSPCGRLNREMRKVSPCGIPDQSPIRPRLKAPQLRIRTPTDPTSPSAYYAKRRGAASPKHRVAWCLAMALPGFGTPPGNCSPKPLRSSIGSTPKKLCTEPLNRSSAQPAKANTGQRRAALNWMMANSTLSSTLSNPMLLPPPKRPNAQCTSFTIALACATQSFTPRVCAPPPASSRLDARWGSGPASNAPACTGPSTAQTPSSPCAAPNSADALRTSGSAAPTGLPHDVIPQNRRAPDEPQRQQRLGCYHRCRGSAVQYAVLLVVLLSVPTQAGDVGASREIPAHYARYFRALGHRVRSYRMERKLTQEDMISYGFSLRHWQMVESGRPITLFTLLRICEAFDIAPETLVEGLAGHLRKRKKG